MLRSALFALGFVLVAILVYRGATAAARGDRPMSATHAAALPHNDAFDLDPNDPKLKVEKTKDEWKRLLTPEQYYVLRDAGTERAFTGAYWNNHEAGVYRCAACGLVIFASADKFDSGTGWPSFAKPISPDRVLEKRDVSWGMIRTEILCPRCGGHLGHVFDDGPPPTHQRYCINSRSLTFVPEAKP